MEITRWWMSANWKLCNVRSRTFILECQSTWIESWIKGGLLTKRCLGTLRFQQPFSVLRHRCVSLDLSPNSNKHWLPGTLTRHLKCWTREKTFEWFNSFRRFSLAETWKSNRTRSMHGDVRRMGNDSFNSQNMKATTSPREKRCERSKNIFGFRRLRFDSVIFLSSKTKKVGKVEIEREGEL